MVRKSYIVLATLPTFEERLEYLRLDGSVGESTFGFDRYLNQAFYHSKEWEIARARVIARDNGFDMGLEDYPIGNGIIVHHMNPVSLEDIESGNADILSPEFLICVSKDTHNAIHYGGESKRSQGLIERRPNDTCPWKG